MSCLRKSEASQGFLKFIAELDLGSIFQVFSTDVKGLQVVGQSVIDPLVEHGHKL